MTEKKTFKEIYIKLRKKYDLPSYEELDKEFEIWEISPKNPYPLREVRRYMVDKFYEVVKLLEKVLYTPDATVIDLYESSTFTKEDLQRVFNILKKLALLLREADLLELDYSEEKEAEWIKRAYEEWKKIKEEIRWVLEKKRDYWTKDLKFRHPKEYLG